MTKNIILAASFSTAPDRLFGMYLDADSHGKITGAPVIIGSLLGHIFQAFDGMISGTILHVAPKHLIVQTWRATHWPADAPDSVLVLSFSLHEGGGQIELVHINVAITTLPV